jgi:hypothetical protein
MEQSISVMTAEDFLQKHQIGIERPQPVAQFVDHHAALEKGQALVNVVGRHT